MLVIVSPGRGENSAWRLSYGVGGIRATGGINRDRQSRHSPAVMIAGYGFRGALLWPLPLYESGLFLARFMTKNR